MLAQDCVAEAIDFTLVDKVEASLLESQIKAANAREERGVAEWSGWMASSVAHVCLMAFLMMLWILASAVHWHDQMTTIRQPDRLSSRLLRLSRAALPSSFAFQ